MSLFVFTTYAMTLIELRLAVGGAPLDNLDEFLVKMQTFYDLVTNLRHPSRIGASWTTVNAMNMPQWWLQIDGKSTKGRGKVTSKTLECLVINERRHVGEEKEQKAKRRPRCASLVGPHWARSRRCFITPPPYELCHPHTTSLRRI